MGDQPQDPDDSKREGGVGAIAEKIDETFKRVQEALERIAEPPVPDDVASEAKHASVKEAQDFDDHRDVELRRREAELSGILQEQVDRTTYAGRTYWLVVGWLGAIFCLILLKGFHGWRGISRGGVFLLSDAVILGLIGGTTASVLALLVIVVRNLFPRRDTLREVAGKTKA